MVSPSLIFPTNHRVCKFCKDFKEWTKEQAKVEPSTWKLPEEAPLMKTVVNSKGEHIACPPNKEELGRATWTFLHTMAAYYPEKATKETQEETNQFLYQFSRIYPCEYCAQHLQNVMVQDPPRTESQQALSEWLCGIHNQVNQLLGKTLFNCRNLNERWRDGPSDGSCD
jgi:FAD-linked sulfhydryl oxidase